MNNIKVVNGYQIDTYELSEDGNFLALMNDEDKANKIATIINSHDELVAMLKKVTELDRFDNDDFACLISNEVNEAKELLAKIEGKS